MTAWLAISRHGGRVTDAAMRMARDADLVVVAAGFDDVTESEGADRTFRLPPGQDELISAMAGANARTVVVMNSGGAVDMNAWIERVPALLQAWYPGQEGGTAIAEILFGHTAKNNIGYWSSSGTFYMIENGWNLTTNPTLDYNNYYPAAGVYYWYGENDSSWTKLSAYSTATGQDANSITTDPLFTNIGANDFTLQANSTAIDAGDFLTRTTSAGSGTVITVKDARYFHDGYGISGVSGDAIRVGDNTVTVTGVNYKTNQITVTPSITWSKGEGVSYPYVGSKPDMGAYEYGGSSPKTSSATTSKDRPLPSASNGR